MLRKYASTGGDQVEKVLAIERDGRDFEPSHHWSASPIGRKQLAVSAFLEVKCTAISIQGK